MLSRREFVASAAAASVAGLAQAAPAKPTSIGVILYSYGIRSRVDREARLSEPQRFLEFCHGRGFNSVQLSLSQLDATACGRLRDRCAELATGVEGVIRTPKDDADASRFEAEVRTAKEAGATVMRTAMLSGRRYETFHKAEEFHEFERQSRRSLELAVPILTRQRMRLAVENHKDYRAGDLADLLRSFSSEYLGCNVDTGNNIALLEDPHEVVKTLAPWAFACHLKDMGVQEYPDGFLLSEVPLGTGFLDLKLIAATLRAAHPEIRLHLEMITRDPLRVPCLTRDYWATFANLPARDLADTLARVRRHASPTDLPRITGLADAEQVALEDNNAKTSLAYAREHLA